MTATQNLEIDLDPPGSISMRVAFFVLWGIDMIAATLFFLVPYATELNPVTVRFYELLGLPGVPIAALCYAVIVVSIGHFLSDPVDRRFIGVMIAVYLVLVTNNVVLLLSGYSPLGV